MQNKVPDGFEDGDRVKVDLRPESVSMDTGCGTETLSDPFPKTLYRKTRVGNSVRTVFSLLLCYSCIITPGSFHCNYIAKSGSKNDVEYFNICFIFKC